MSWIFGHVVKRLEKKGKVNFKIYDVTICIQNNYNKHVFRYLKQLGQLGDEIWSVNKT